MAFPVNSSNANLLKRANLLRSKGTSYPLWKEAWQRDRPESTTCGTRAS